MRILFIGDIVGRPGVDIVCQAIPGFRRQESIDLIIVNGENAESGSGITKSIYKSLIAAGVDCITLGDHIFRKKEIMPILESKDNIVKPANFPKEAPGKNWTVVKSETGKSVAVFSLIGRVFMKPVDCPYHRANEILDEIPDEVKIRFCDFHAEATSDKQLMGRHLAGRVTAVCGTHTHVPTADEQILPGGTAFISDVGMTGPHESILGRRIDRVLEATMTFRPVPFDVATKDVQISGVVIEVDASSGQAQGIRRIKINERDAERLEDDYDE
ncbi:MAG: TIGR00282 family metallophosphoesterase [Planctomycetota bacterium]